MDLPAASDVLAGRRQSVGVQLQWQTAGPEARSTAIQLIGVFPGGIAGECVLSPIGVNISPAVIEVPPLDHRDSSL